MDDYRVHVPRDSYRGSNPRRLEKRRRDSQLCDLIEAELQRRYDAIKPGEMTSIMAHEVASSLDQDAEAVRRIMFRIQGGSNGVTFSKEPPNGQSWEDAWRAESERPLPPSQAATADGQLKLGDRVNHAHFGSGVINHIHGDKLNILFDESGEKRVIASFVRGLAE